MLGKIIKYDFKALCRYLLPIYAILVGSAIALRLCLEITGALDGSFLGGALVFVFALTFILATLATMLSAFIIITIHFYKSLLTDQGYFYLVLPVSHDAHLISKILTGAIFIVISFLALLVSFIPFAVGNVDIPQILDGLRDFFNIFGAFVKEPNGIPILILSAFTLLFGFQIKVYFSIALGQLWQKHRVLGAFLAYMGIGMATRILSAILSVNSFNALKLITNPYNVLSKTTGLFMELLIFTVALYFVEYFLTRYIMKNKLNIE